ncbi:MAG: GTP 3',8-cyclase MoaA [Chloroflexota bacterium]
MDASNRSCLNDSYNRPISYLRVAVTDRCNYRCVYCMPPNGVPVRSREEILRYEEIALVVRAAASLGISKVRLTGGEPLVRPQLEELVRALSHVPGIDDLALTTNGALLSRYARELARAGLRRVNVSLDTLRPQRFRQITRYGDLEPVLQGIAAAQEAGLAPLKINTVVVRGLNLDEVVDIAGTTLVQDWHVRFIELMPLGEECLAPSPGAGDPADVALPGGFVPVAEMVQTIESDLGPLEPAKLVGGNGPARYYRLSGARGTVGFISPVSEHFCYQCNRLRLTADGRLRPCLLSEDEIDLRAPLRAGATVEELKGLIVQAVVAKPERHRLQQRQVPRSRIMSEIGG